MAALDLQKYKEYAEYFQLMATALVEDYNNRLQGLPAIATQQLTGFADSLLVSSQGLKDLYRAAGAPASTVPDLVILAQQVAGPPPR